MRWCIWLALFAGSFAVAEEFYVSAGALPTGNGSAASPWPLRTALAHPSIVKPGDTIWIYGGIYRGRFNSRLAGEAGRPITVRAYPGEWVTINGNNGATLISPVSPTDNAITVSDPADVMPGSEIRVDDKEELKVLTATGNRLTVIRGWSGTAAKAHAANSPVKSKAPVLTVAGRHAWFWGFELMSSDPVRVTPIAGSTSVDISRGTGIDVRGEGIKLINLIVHDTADAIGLAEGALDTEVAGCLSYYNGWQGPDRGHGHGIYIQNRIGRKSINDVISFNNFATGMKVFGESGYAVGVDFDGGIIFNNGSVRDARQPKETNLYVGTGRNPGDLINISNNSLYHTPGVLGENLHIGYVSPNKRVSITNNYVAGGSFALDLTRWEQAVVKGNTFFVSSMGFWSAQTMASVKTPDGFALSAYEWDSNTYFDGAPPYGSGMRYTFGFTGAKNNLGGGILSFSDWRRANGFDTNSRYEANLPQGTKIFVRPNTYEPGRANVAVFNWDKNGSVELDLYKILKPGDAYSIRDAQNYYGEAVASGVYDGRPVVIPMNLNQVARPVGNLPTVPPHTAPLFGAFVVVTIGGNTGSTPPSAAGRGAPRRRLLPFDRGRRTEGGAGTVQ